VIKYFNQSQEILNFLHDYLQDREVGIKEGDKFIRNILFSKELLEEYFEKKKIFSIHHSVEKYQVDYSLDFDKMKVNELLFVIDIDSNKIKKSLEMSISVLNELKKYNLIPTIKFSGNKGFHIFFPVPFNKKRNYEYYRKVLKFLSIKVSGEISETVFFDAQVISRRHLIRSPFSINEKSIENYKKYLVSGFVNYETLEDLVMMQ